MLQTENIKKAILGSALLLACLALSGCVSAPTYGTDKTSTEQLIDDLTSIASLKSQKGADIEYRPRPDLVQPPTGASLPEPQTSVVKNEQIWPESPEEIRDRLVAAADANPNETSRLTSRNRAEQRLTSKQQREAYLEARKVQKGQYKDRRFLSDPPAGYKVPATTAPIGELGETESTKERLAKAGATVKGTGKRWWEVWKR